MLQYCGSNIQYMNLSQCSLGAEGAFSLASVIPSLPKLHTLCIDNNPLIGIQADGTGECITEGNTLICLVLIFM